MSEERTALDDVKMAEALERAVFAAGKSPCQKSKRGAVIWDRGGPWETGYNHPPEPFKCDGSAKCREHCNKRCIHAEVDAIMNMPVTPIDKEMLHIKVVDGEPVPSGPPFCWQCSRHILDAGIKTMWLLEEDGWKSYTAMEFHTITMRNCGI